MVLLINILAIFKKGHNAPLEIFSYFDIQYNSMELYYMKSIVNTK